MNYIDIVKDLEKAGFKREQAESQVKAFGKLMDDVAKRSDIVVLKADIIVLKSDIKVLKTEMIHRFEKSDMARMSDIKDLKSDMDKLSHKLLYSVCGFIVAVTGMVFAWFEFIKQ